MSDQTYTTAAFILCIVSLGLMIPSAYATTPVFPDATWQTRTPAQVGLDPAQLDLFRIATGSTNGPGCIVRYGYMVYTWGDQTSHDNWSSAMKPIMATMLFFAVHEGKLTSVDSLIKDLGWPLNAKDQTMSFRHLADMTGYALPEAPGTHFGYNDYGIKLYSLSLFDRVYQVSGGDAAAISALMTDPSRMGPLQFQDGNLFGAVNGIMRCNMTPRDFARMGWFWLNKGNWKGTQLLPRRFFDDYVTKADVPTDLPQSSGGTLNDYLGIGSASSGTGTKTLTGQGSYGFNWWFNGIMPNGQRAWPDAPVDTFTCWGTGGNINLVIPSLGIVATWLEFNR